jgi:hypothetical protein
MKGKSILLAMIFGILVSSLFGQETLLEKANAFYDMEDYSNAKELYLQVLSAGKFSGETLYRYVYSLERLNGLNSDILDLYAVTNFYLAMDGSNNQYEEYCKNKLESNLYDTSKLTWGQSQDMVKNHVKANMLKYSPLKNITMTLRSSGTFGLIVFLIFSIVVYILAYTFSKKTKCIIIWSWWDLIFIAISSLIFIFYLFDFENKIKNDSAINVIYFIATITTFGFSVISNIKYSPTKWPLYAFISVLTKFVLLVVIPLVFVLAIICWYLANSGKRDRRYRDGTKNNQRTKNYNFYVPMFTAIYTFLIINLIKFDKKLKEE